MQNKNITHFLEFKKNLLKIYLYMKIHLLQNGSSAAFTELVVK